MNLGRLIRRSRSVHFMFALGAVALCAVGFSGCFPGQVLPGGNQAPVLVINAPTLDVDLRSGQDVIVSYETSDPDGDLMTVSIYYDVDGLLDTNDEIIVATGLASGSTYYSMDTAAILPGQYYILMESRDNRGGRTVRYAQGQINVIGPRTVAFQQPTSDIRVAVGDTVTIRFTSSESINYTLFYDLNGEDDGDEVTIASGAGQNVSQAWVLNNVTPDTYYVGVRIRDGLGQTETVYASGKVTLDSPPSVEVSTPNTDKQVYAGQTVNVEYDVSDPDSDARVTIFVDVDRVPDNGNETTVISGLLEPEGDANYAIDTTSIPPAAYYVGVSATDNLNDPVTAYAPGRIEIFSSGLTILFLTPSGDVSLAPGDVLNVSWQITAPLNGGKMDLVYVEIDGSGDPVGPEMFILEEASLRPDATTFNTNVLDVDEGATYELRIKARPTFGSPLVKIGPRILIRSNPNIGLLQPTSSLTVGMGDQLPILWEVAHLQSDIGLISAQILLDPDLNQESGNEISLIPVTKLPTGTPGTVRFSATMDLTQTPVPLGNYYMYLSVNDGGTFYRDYASATTSVQQVGEQLIIVTVTPRVSGVTTWMGDAGKDLTGNGITDSIIFIGFDFYDSAGSLVASLGDFDGDSRSDFLIVSQFAKPFRDAPVGDAYVIYGDPTRFAASLAVSNVSIDPNIAILNLNSVGTTIRGALAVGPSQVTTPDAASEGIRAAAFLPDLTSDGVGELAFGLPYVHNSQSLTVVTPDGRTPTELTRAGQMRRGAVVVATSSNNLNQNSALPLEQILFLDSVGQVYSGGLEDPTVEEINRLAGDPSENPEYHRIRLLTPSQGWSHPLAFDPLLNDMAGPRPVPELGVGALADYADDDNNTYLWHPTNNPRLVDGNTDGEFKQSDWYLDRCYYTGYINGAQVVGHGSRIVGDEQGAGLGSAIDWWRGALVMSSSVADWAGRPNAGVVYVKKMRDRITGALSVPWGSNPKPSNLVVQTGGNYSHPTLGNTAGIIYGAAAGAELGPVASLANEALGRPGDFNGDGLDDLALGSPGMNTGDGAIYVFYVRMPEPYQFDLAQLNTLNSDPSRRAGVQINGNGGDELGSIQPDGLDFNNDGFADAVFGSPKADADRGEVILLYGGPQVTSTGAGWSIDDIAYGPGEAAPGDPNKALGVVFQGINPGDSAGAAAATIGDFDGDGLDDLAVAAPYATPIFDSDDDGVPDTEGIDRDGDGQKDDVDGNGVVDAADTLTGAGVVYLIYGQRNVGTGTTKGLTGYVDLSMVGTTDLPGLVFVGKTPGDALGGGMTTRDGITPGTRALGIASAGDVDGDGLTDLLISSVSASPLGHVNAGEVYLVFGLAAGVQP